MDTTDALVNEIRNFGDEPRVISIRAGENVPTEKKLHLIVESLKALVAQGRKSLKVRDWGMRALDDAGIDMHEGKKPYLPALAAIQAHMLRVGTYAHDPAFTERFSSAEKTLFRSPVPGPFGDCDDQAVAYASVVGAIGFPSGVLLLDARGTGQLDHAMALVKTPVPVSYSIADPWGGPGRKVWDGGKEWLAVELTKVRPIGWYPRGATVFITAIPDED